ncbi:MAG TPA: discoidin domain-containing protein [Phycisphaerae bacterium]|nr:discoidin domain-containing protein [Phycisphaerae bacterium]
MTRSMQMQSKALTRTLLTLLAWASLAVAVHGQHKDIERPAAWKNLVPGGRFMDRFEPMPLLGKRTADTWGVDAVKPRDVLNGIEEGEWSYWGGNILQGEDGRYHLFVCRWREDDPRGHMAWPASEVVRCVSKNRFGPYKVAEVLGGGHNPEAYRLKDGRYVCYVVDAYYLGATLEGPWERKTFQFDPRDRPIVEGLSNLSFVQREDGSYLMVCRGGGIWVSRDGLSTWEQITQGSVYPKVQGRFEDPVIWRTTVQYHLIVNDWYGRIAYHLRSKNGVHWKVDPGEAYMPGIAVSEDGKKEEWYKYERMKVFQDKHGRAIQANFAVIDYSKWEDKANDIHSSKNIAIPLTVDRLLTLLSQERVTDATKQVRVKILAESGFDPQKDVALESLRFGAPEEVDFGRGARLLRTEKDGRDLVAVFTGKGCGFEDHNFAGKLLGRTSGGKLLFGYTRLPWVTYDEPLLTVRQPQVVGQGKKRSLRIEVSNHGQVASRPSEVRVDPEHLTMPDTLSRGKPATASSIWLDPGFEADKAVDGDTSTRWSAAGGTRSGWLEVDLGQPERVGRAVIRELAFPRTQRFVVEYLDGQTWKELARGTTIAGAKVLDFAPVTARHFRLNILEASEVPTIEEFGLLPPAKKETELTIKATCPALRPYEKTLLEMPIPDAYKSGREYQFLITTGLEMQQPTVFTAKKITMP